MIKTVILALLTLSFTAFGASVTDNNFKRVVTAEGNAYSIATGLITLTDDTESAILYSSFNEACDVMITHLTLKAGPAMNILQKRIDNRPAIIRQYALPTTGTLITDAVPAVVANFKIGPIMNFLSPATKNYVGGQGKTVDGWLVGSEPYNPGREQEVDLGEMQMAPGGGVALTIQPPQHNTHMQVAVKVEAYLFNCTE